MSKDGFGLNLLESGEVIKKSLGAAVGNIGKTTAIITILVAALVTFTEIGFYDFGAAAVTSNAMLLLIASYLMYFSLEESGERLGESSEEFKSSSERYRTALEKIRPEDISALREFCSEYSECELEFRRRNRFMSLGISPVDYERHKHGEKISSIPEKKLKMIDKVKPISLCPEMLLERDRTRNKSELINPECGKILRLSLRLIPTTICTLFTASVMLSAKDGLSVISVIEGILKLSCLPIIGFRGYAQGYNYAKGARRAWIDTKARLLEAFTAKRENK